MDGRNVGERQRGTPRKADREPWPREDRSLVQVLFLRSIEPHAALARAQLWDPAQLETGLEGGRLPRIGRPEPGQERQRREVVHCPCLGPIRVEMLRGGRWNLG